MNKVRPISARALKSVCDTLRPWLEGARVLDLYCGSCRFGLAALREKAMAITFVDKFNRKAPLPSQAIFYKSDAFSFLQRAAKRSDKFDIIFADPPFPIWEAQFFYQLFELVSHVCTENAIFLVKYPSQMIIFPTPAGFQTWKSSTIGESKLLYFNYA